MCRPPSQAYNYMWILHTPCSGEWGLSWRSWTRNQKLLCKKRFHVCVSEIVYRVILLEWDEQVNRKSQEFHPCSSKHVRQQPSCLITLEPQPAPETLPSPLSAPPTLLSAQHFDLWPPGGWWFTHCHTWRELFLHKKCLKWRIWDLCTCCTAGSDN